mmetsp:Transcript_59334/g.150298  ORF Transcript_59334/g.150298 Transcript_59334/m.150298 type:complete len:111 (-) Transcript_59334:54-386(-)
MPLMLERCWLSYQMLADGRHGYTSLARVSRRRNRIRSHNFGAACLALDIAHKRNEHRAHAVFSAGSADVQYLAVMWQLGDCLLVGSFRACEASASTALVKTEPMPLLYSF